MASYGSFPSIDFSWLGELPGIVTQTADAARLRAARQSLSDLDPRDPKTLEQAAGRLIAAGDLEGGSKLYSLATARRGVDQRSAADEAYKQVLPLLLGNKTQTPAPAGGGTFTYEPTDTGTAPALPGTGLLPWPTPRPQSALPVPPPGPQVAQNIPPPPPDVPVPPGLQGQINIPPQSAAATQITPPPPPGPMPPEVAAALAGPPPTPDTGPPTPPVAPPVAPNAPPPGFNPNFFQPPIDTTTVPGAAPKTVQLPSTLYNPVDLTKSLDAVRNQILALGAAGKGGTQASQMLEAQFHNLLTVGKASESERNYQLDQLQNEKLGLPRQTRQDWENLNKDYPARAADFRKAFNDYRTAGIKGSEVIPQLEALKGIIQSPAYNSGPGTQMFNGAVATLNAGINSLRRYGIPEEYLPDISTLKDPARLADAYTAMVHQIVISSLGGLGKQVSNSDVRYQNESFGDLKKTPEGNMLIAEYQLERAKQAAGVGEAAARYAEKYGETRGTVVGLDKAVKTYINDNPILGPDSPLRQRMDEQLKKASPQTGAAYTPIIEGAKTAVTEGPATVKDSIQRNIVEPIRQVEDTLNNASTFGQKARQYILDNVFGSGGAVPAPQPPGTRTAPVASTAPAPTPQQEFPPAPKVIPPDAVPLKRGGKKYWQLPDGSITQRD